MSLQRYSKTIFLLIFGIALLLVACERPSDEVVDIPQTGGEPAAETQEGAAEETAADTAGEETGEEVVAEGETAAEENAGEQAGEEAAAEETGEESPRTDEEATAEETSEGEVAEEETTEEATTEETSEDETSVEAMTEDAAEGEAAEEATAEEATTDEAAETTDEAATEETSEGESTGEAATQPGSTEERIHVVADGENLYRIGLQYGLSWVVLQQHNGIANVTSLTVGQEIKIPPTETAEPDEPAPTPTPTPTDEQTYTVQDGDNLFRIGLEYGLDWTQIAEANGIVNPQQLTVGQVLKIPASQPGESPEFTHVVQDGETLFLISIQYGTTWNSIAEANELETPFVIYPDQTLIIPGN